MLEGVNFNYLFLCIAIPSIGKLSSWKKDSFGKFVNYLYFVRFFLNLVFFFEGFWTVFWIRKNNLKQ